MKRHIVLLLATTLFALSSIARDFSYTYQGKRLNYTVLNETAKTCQLKGGDFFNPGHNISGDVIIPEKAYDGTAGYEVIAIGGYSFANCSGLTSIEIPNTVESIRSWAFAYCSGLTSIRIPDGVDVIDMNAFYQCSNITSVEIGSSLMSLGRFAFSSCNKIEQINVSSDNKYFSSVNGVLFDKQQSTLLIYPANKSGSSYSIPNAVKTVAEHAFEYCNNLISIEIGRSLSTIELFAIQYCYNLEKFVVNSENESFSTIDGVLCDKQQVKLIQYPSGKHTTTYSIPNSIKTIGEEAFCYAMKLRTVIISDAVETIESDAFGGLDITSVEFGNSVKHIGDGAFMSCNKLTSIKLPKSVKSLGSYAFSTVSLTTFSVAAIEPPTCNEYTFGFEIEESIILYVPVESVSTYKQAVAWKNFKNIVGDPKLAINEIKSTNSIAIVANNGAIEVSGAESVRVFNIAGMPVYAGKSQRIQLPSGIYVVKADTITQKVII